MVVTSTPRGRMLERMVDIGVGSLIVPLQVLECPMCGLCVCLQLLLVVGAIRC